MLWMGYESMRRSLDARMLRNFGWNVHLRDPVLWMTNRVPQRYLSPRSPLDPPRRFLFTVICFRM